MPQYIPEADWQKGMIRDAPRVAIPPGGFYDATDFMFNNPALAYKRGGTSYAGPVMGTANYAKTLAYVADYSTPQLVAVGDDNHWYKITAGTTTDLGFKTNNVTEKMKVWTVNSTGQKYWLCAAASTTGINTWDGTTLATMSASIGFQYTEVYKGRLVANGDARPPRLFFSDPPDTPGFTNYLVSWIDTSHKITGLAALQNMLLIFSQGAIERITGSIPPPGSDMDLSPLIDIGSPWAQSLTVWNNQCIFANVKGVYATNGVTAKDLTTQGGISTYWQSLFASGGQTVATGVYQHRYLFVTVLNSDRTLVDTLVCDLARIAWWRLTNIKAMAYARFSGTAQADELFYANASSARVITLSGCFSPSSSNKNDADGTAVTPMLETRPVDAGMTLKSYGLARVSYDMRDAASDNPTLAVQYAAGAEAPSYSTVAESPLAETSNMIKKKVTVNQVAQALSFKLTQTNASAKTEVYGLEVETQPLPAEAGGPYA